MDTARERERNAGPRAADPAKEWQKTTFANLIRYVSSGTYYARLRVKGKLIRRSLNTDVLSVAKLRLADFEKQERQRSEAGDAVARGRMTVADAIQIHRERVAGDASLKPRTKEYHDQRIAALLKTWPGLERRLIRDVTKTECLNWAARFSACGGRKNKNGESSKASPTALNHSIGILRTLFEIGIEVGGRYDNPAKSIKLASERPKHLVLPETEQFERFANEVENGGGGLSQACADLVRFLAFGGFRKGEAASVTWGDCDFDRG